MESIPLIKFAIISASKLVGLPCDVTPDVCYSVAGLKPDTTHYFLLLLCIFLYIRNNISSSYRSFIYGKGMDIRIKKISLKKRYWTFIINYRTKRHLQSNDKKDSQY